MGFPRIFFFFQKFTCNYKWRKVQSFSCILGPILTYFLLCYSPSYLTLPLLSSTSLGHLFPRCKAISDLLILTHTHTHDTLYFPFKLLPHFSSSLPCQLPKEQSSLNASCIFYLQPHARMISVPHHPMKLFLLRPSLISLIYLIQWPVSDPLPPSVGNTEIHKMLIPPRRNFLRLFNHLLLIVILAIICLDLDYKTSINDSFRKIDFEHLLTTRSCTKASKRW